MDFYSKKAIKKTLRQENIFPKKSLGQNFLIDKNALKKIVETGEVSGKDIVLEIGPGLGALTWELIQKAKKVVAVEKDTQLAQALKQRLENPPNLTVVEGDALKIPNILQTLFPLPPSSPSVGRIIPLSSSSPSGRGRIEVGEGYKLMGNLPYNSGLAIIMKFLEADRQPKMIAATLQKEVAEKICSDKKMSLPGIATRYFGNPKICGIIPKELFFPEPKVDGAILKITDIQKRENKKYNELFFKILRAGFSSPRKTILNNLSAPSLYPSPSIGGGGKGWGRKNSSLPRASEVPKTPRGIVPGSPTKSGMTGARSVIPAEPVPVKTGSGDPDGLDSRLRGNDKRKGAVVCPKKQTALWLKKAGIPPQARPETLSLKNWLTLVDSFPK
jgi:16S rRNA (adenine1518-N6/adenine1519-N6)-dimethyltransferase